ncbi:membrane dipeptidase (peptidase family M19) [Anaerotignum neopropionicum]|uniref:Membrane dipeptidase (Peptidase family M19) n=1 Tax=Anaerotignum neopropionicum TaxID=36847 RepID=A0A136WET5_9FIRM|nr:membrane dipeptidase [Anaerotignum neopropionicum]KXL52869.1 membrane dipeptidase (peptidase family M19) [Anaerotignum neopropionicum]
MIFDGHSDIFTDVTIKRLLGETQVIKNHHLTRLRKGGVEGGCFVIWIDPPYDKEPSKRLEQILKATKEEMAECDKAVLVHNMAEIEAAKKAGKFFILLGMEGLSGIGEDVEQIHMLYDFGARHAMLTWNEQNPLATGVQGDPCRGLTELGKKAVRLLQHKKMIMDVSHLNERSFWDVMDVSEGPILASHSNAKALAAAARNLTDEQLLEIRDTKGLVGLNSFNLFVSEDVNGQNVDNLVKHASYIADKIGVEHLGFGFDFFEFLSTDSMRSYSSQETSFTVGLEDCSKVPELLIKMKAAGFTEKELEMVSGGNWLNLIHRVIG